MPTSIRIRDFMLFFNNPEEQEIQIYDLDTHDIIFQNTSPFYPNGGCNILQSPILYPFERSCLSWKFHTPAVSAEQSQFISPPVRVIPAANPTSPD